MPRTAAASLSLPEALLQAFKTNDRINQYLLQNLHEAAWRAEPPDGLRRFTGQTSNQEDINDDHLLYPLPDRSVPAR